MPADKIISINLDSTNPRQANVNAMPAFTFGNTDRVRIELYSGGELAAFDTTKDYIFALGINGRASAGGYVLTYGGDSTQELPATAAPSAVESALNALASVAALGGLKVVGSNGGPYKIVWTESGAREAISAKNTLYPNAAVYSRIITSGDDGTAAQQALAFKLSLLSNMSNVQYLDVERTIETTEYVEVQKPVSVTTKTTVTDPETGETTTTETTETRTETVTEPQVNTTTEKIKGAMEFDLSLATVEAFLAIGGASNLSAMAELAEVSASGEIKTRLLCECSIFNGVIPDAGTLIIASQELANITATAKFYAIGTQETPPSIIAGTIPSESDKGSAYYYAQLAANSQAVAEGAEEAATQAQAAATQAQTAKETAVNAANGAAESAQAAQASQAAAAQSETNAQASAQAAAGSATQAQESATQAQAAQTAAETAAQIAQATDAGKLALSKLSAGTLYFNQAKLFGSNFTIPNFPFSICATVRVDSWEGSTQGIQTIFQFGDSGTGALWGSICFNNVKNNPNIQLRISKNTDGTSSYSEVSYFFNKDTFLGKEHTIIGVFRELESTPVNFDIYVDGAKVATSYYKGLTLDSLSGTVNYAVNTYNQNYSIQPASAHPMMLRNLYVFNFDVSAPAAPYSIADYVAGRLIPPALKPSQVSLALENYTIARNATTKLVKDASGNSNDATVQGSGTVAGDNDQSIKAFVDEIKTQINQSNG